MKRLLGTLVAWSVAWTVHPAASRAQEACPGDSVYTSAWEAMGTRFRLQVVAPDRTTADAWAERAREEVERVDRLLSDYRSDSEWERLHRERSVVTDPELFGVLRHVDAIVAATGGLFDPSVGALMDAWGFRSGRFAVPSDSTLARLTAISGWNRIRFDAEERRLTLPSPPYRLDPGGFGKGYAADRVIGILVTLGANCALLDAGASTYRASAPPPGRAGWPARLPGSSSDGDGILMAHVALSTSGASGRSFVADGRTWGHLLDPRSGRPAGTGGVVHVLADTAFDADALSTALYVAGESSAPSILARFPGARARFVPGSSGWIAAPDP